VLALQVQVPAQTQQQEQPHQFLVFQRLVAALVGDGLVGLTVLVVPAAVALLVYRRLVALLSAVKATTAATAT
jgi:hypothetical protein